ncbi:hypothetical protein E3G69_000621 [Mycobacteroides abscessus]|nr:hypothetical protein [Mycobacteroides abscessus]QOF41604.1 hypothetical protein E3G69_000621 [Mycobacteroides abscessus]QOF46300.1 hypothetical protein E3G70_000617 [Mycobacteroides abscessus]
MRQQCGLNGPVGASLRVALTHTEYFDSWPISAIPQYPERPSLPHRPQAQENRNNLGDQAFGSLGGLFLVDTPEQRRRGIKDSSELAWQDWLESAASDREDGEDLWLKGWACAYVEFANSENVRTFIGSICGLLVEARRSCVSDPTAWVSTSVSTFGR